MTNTATVRSENILVNFHIPPHLKGNVDDLCKFKGMSKVQEEDMGLPMPILSSGYNDFDEPSGW